MSPTTARTESMYRSNLLPTQRLDRVRADMAADLRELVARFRV